MKYYVESKLTSDQLWPQKDRGQGQSRLIIDEKYIERLKKKKTRLVITSGGNEPVVDSVGGRHSLFASKLIDTLKNNNTVINSQILFENIRRYVVSNADQTPERAMVHKTGHDGGDFLFFSKNQKKEDLLFVIKQIEDKIYNS